MNLTREELWDKLRALSTSASSIRTLVDEDERHSRHRLFEHGPLLIDYARQDINQEAMSILLDLARASDLENHIQKLFSGAPINQSEQRAVLHMAFRDWGGRSWQVAGRSVAEEVGRLQEQAWDHAEKLAQELALKHIVVLGIGGSSSGAKLLLDYFAWTGTAKVSVSFFESYAGDHLAGALASLPLAHTVVLVVSKSFGTSETLANASVAKKQMTTLGMSGDAIAERMIAITANVERAKQEGFLGKNILALPEWVGGRYSVWTSTSYAVVAACGRETFASFLRGAADMDQYFTETPLETNHVIALALCDVWQRTIKRRSHWMIAPYHDALKKLESYLQQLIMESNGKLNLDGLQSSAAVWGGTGTEFQHSFGQWLHQGDAQAWVDFIGVIHDERVGKAATQSRFEHMLAQSAALMNGKEASEDPNNAFPGNRPSNCILLKTPSPEALGALIALYEHRTFVQATLWGINAFDQPGVELGKIMSKQIHEAFENDIARQSLDHSSAKLIEYFAKVQDQAYSRPS